MVETTQIARASSAEIQATMSDFTNWTSGTEVRITSLMSDGSYQESSPTNRNKGGRQLGTLSVFFFYFFTLHGKEEKFANINLKNHYNTRLSAKECFSVKFSRTEKIKKNLLLELLSVSIWNSITLSVKTLNIFNFRKQLNHYSLMF